MPHLEKDAGTFHDNMGPHDLGQLFSDIGRVSSFFAEKTFGRSVPGGNMCTGDILCGRPFRSVEFFRAGLQQSAMGWGRVAFCDALLKSHGNVFLSTSKDKICVILKSI